MKELKGYRLSDKSIEDFDKQNATAWELLAEQHFKTGAFNNLVTMDPDKILGSWALKWADIGNVEKVCHLACHLGVEAIAWARSGYNAIGIDRSVTALEGAKIYAKRLFTNKVNWCLADIRKGIPICNQSIDLIWMSHGSIYWYPDLRSIIGRITEILKPDGIFLIEEIHPISLTISTEHCSKHPTLQKYSFNSIPGEKRVKMQYAGGRLPFLPHIWIHSLGDIISDAISNGLVIDELIELRWTTFKQFPFLIKKYPNRWFPHKDYQFQPPLSFRLALRRK